MASEDFDDFPEHYTPNSKGEFPWDHPCWNSDWEDELVQADYKTIQQWNALGRVVKKGSFGTYLTFSEKKIFNINQTFCNKRLASSFIAKQDPKKKTDNECHSKKDAFLLRLLKQDGKYIKTKSNTWIEGVVFKRQEESLFILIRKKGIDIKFFNKNNGSFNEKNNQFSFEKGFFFRMNYSEKDTVVFSQVEKFLKLFKKGCEITTIISLVYCK